MSDDTERLGEAARECAEKCADASYDSSAVVLEPIIADAMRKVVTELDDDTHNIILRQKLALAKQKIEEQEEEAERLAFEVRGDTEELEAERDELKSLLRIERKHRATDSKAF